MSFSPRSLKRGDELVVTFRSNPRPDSQFPLVANKTNLGVSPKMIVPVHTDGFNPQSLEQWRVVVDSVSKPKDDHHGIIRVRPKELLLELDTNDEVWVDPRDARAMLVGLQDPDCNVMLEGEQGVGKTTLGMWYAKMLGATYKHVSGNMIKKLSQLTGKTNAGTTGNQLTFRYADSEFTDLIRYAWQHPRERVLGHMDELSRMEEDCRDGTLNVTEGKVRKIWLPNGECLPVGRNIMWFATGNVGSMFVLKREDAAYKSRWMVFRMGFMPQDNEIALCQKRFPDCPTELIVPTVTIINSIRKSRFTAELQLPKVPSVRESINAARLFAKRHPDFTIDYVLGITVVNQYGGYTENQHSDAGKAARYIIERLKELKCPTGYLEQRIKFAA